MLTGQIAPSVPFFVTPAHSPQQVEKAAKTRFPAKDVRETQEYEAVLREDGSPDPQENSVTTSGDPSNYKVNKKVYNPTTKKFEDVETDVKPSVASQPAIQYPNDLDNGLPAKTAANWKEVVTDNSSSSWKTYQNSKTGQAVSFDPTTSELWYNPVKQQWEPVVREASEQSTYIKSVARQLLYKNKPARARHWKCNAYGTVHNDPSECADPDKGGVWLTD
jgi:hypothetical protein